VLVPVRAWSYRRTVAIFDQLLHEAASTPTDGWDFSRLASRISTKPRPWDFKRIVEEHAGECEVVDGNVARIAVSIGARVAAQAAPGEALVSQTVKHLVAGSGIAFADRGASELNGLPGGWRLYAVAA
jgi:class 3 adenylate cyclase